MRLLARIRDDLDAMEKAYWSASDVNDAARASRIRARIRRLHQRYARVQNAANRIVQQLLRSDTVNESHFTWPESMAAERRKRYEAGIRRFQELWGAMMPASATVAVRKRTGAYANQYYVPALREMYDNGVIYLLPNTPLHTIIHELTHAAEEMIPGALQRSLAFRASIVQGETPTSLRERYKGYNYAADEMAFRDQMDERMGKGASYALKVYQGDEATEILTMGVQWLVQRPIDFARNFPEYFDFVIETLWGQW